MAFDFARISKSEAETSLIGAALGRLLRAGDVLLIDGPLGAGKTTLVRSIAAGMNLDTGAVASPTFVLSHEYSHAPASEGPGLIHIDAYRLRDPTDLDSLGWDTITARVWDHPESAMVVEWAERLGGRLKGAAPARLRIEHVDEVSREMSFTVPDSWRTRPGFDALAARKATTCPVTGRTVPPESPTYPFADERARMADLYRWFSGSYSVSRDAREADFTEP